MHRNHTTQQDVNKNADLDDGRARLLLELCLLRAPPLLQLLQPALLQNVATEQMLKSRLCPYAATGVSRDNQVGTQRKQVLPQEQAESRASDIWSERGAAVNTQDCGRTDGKRSGGRQLWKANTQRQHTHRTDLGVLAQPL